MRNVTLSPEGEVRKIRVKIRVNSNGIFLVPSATAIDLQQVEDEPVCF